MDCVQVSFSMQTRRQRIQGRTIIHVWGSSLSPFISYPTRPSLYHQEDVCLHGSDSEWGLFLKLTGVRWFLQFFDWQSRQTTSRGHLNTWGATTTVWTLGWVFYRWSHHTHQHRITFLTFVPCYSKTAREKYVFPVNCPLLIEMFSEWPWSGSAETWQGEYMQFTAEPLREAF